MFTKLKKLWIELKRLEPGQRFETHYRRHRQSEAGKSPVRRVLFLFAAVVAFVVGVVLVFIPGPAILFFLIAAGLLAMQSLRVARALDWSELRGRAAVKKIRRRLGRGRTALSSHR
jgi:Flp pilus assembly protein TadB